MSVSSVGGSQNNPYIPTDEVDNTSTPANTGTDGNKEASATQGSEGSKSAQGSQGTQGAHGTQGSQATENTQGVKETGNTKGPDAISLLSLGTDSGDTKGKVEPAIEKPQPNFNISIACAGLSDMTALLNEVMQMMGKIKRDNSEAAFQSAMANVSSLKSDADEIKENAVKQKNLAIASALINGVIQIGQGAMQIGNSFTSMENIKLKERAKEAEKLGNLDLANVLKEQIQNNKHQSEVISGGTEIRSGMGKMVSGILDAYAKNYEAQTNAYLKESEAFRAQNDATSKVIQDAADSANDVIKQAVDVLKAISDAQAQTRRSILG